MARQAIQATDPLQDRAQVRLFTVADYVAEEPSGKLYISGAGLEWVGLPARTGLLPSFYLAIRLAFPIGMKREMYAIEIRAVDAADDPVGPDPLLKAEIRFDLDAVPSDARELSGNLPVHITNYPITVQPNDVIFLHLLVDGDLVSQLPIQLLSIDS